MEISEKEVLRYLGVKNKNDFDPEMIKKISSNILSSASPKSVYKKFSVSSKDGFAVIDNEIIESRSLARHLRGCRQAYLFAATLGVGCDNAVRKYSVKSMAEAAVAQAACTALIESYCDDICNVIASEEKGKYLRPRFSPGYGDFPLQYQKSLLPRLEVDKRVGITLMDTLIMTPSKSVSAVIGITSDKECNAGKCKDCSNKECDFREI